MSTHITPKLLLAIVVAGITAPVVAAEMDHNQKQNQTRSQDQMRDQDIYGNQVMTMEERNTFRNQMRAAKTSEERDRLRNEHQTQMQIRAKERGVTLQDGDAGNQGQGSGRGDSGKP